MNQITNPKNNKFIRIISLITITVGVFVIIVFFVFSKTYPDFKLFDVLFVPMELRTTIEHQKALGIKTAKISGAEEKQLKSMIDKSVKAQMEYYSTEKDESLEKIKNLYLPEAFKEYKENVKRETLSNKESQKHYKDEKLEFDIQNYDKIKAIKFSRPVTYKDLSGRIGVSNHVKFEGGGINVLEQLFIFKKINDEWKIEKQKEINVRTEMTEVSLVQQIKASK